MVAVGGKRRGAALAVVLACACGSEQSVVGVESMGGSSPSVDVPSDPCEGATVLAAADFAVAGKEHWEIETLEQVQPLIGARSVKGAVVIVGDGITELPELPCLESIDTLWIQKTRLVDLSAFRRLVRVAETLKVERNHSLVDLHGLDALEEVGGLFDISDNDGLDSFAGLPSLGRVGTFSAFENPGVRDAAGMPAITADAIRLGGEFVDILGLAATSSPDYTIRSASLASLEGLPVRPQMRALELGGGTFDSLAPLAVLEECGSLKIAGNAALTSLAGLENLVALRDQTALEGYLLVSGNTALRDLSALAKLGVVDGWIEIDDNPELTSLAGLEQIAGTRQLAITANPKLANLDALLFGALTSVDDYVRVTSNWTLPHCYAEALCARFPSAQCQVANNDERSTEGC